MCVKYARWGREYFALKTNHFQIGFSVFIIFGSNMVIQHDKMKRCQTLAC